MKKIDIFTHFFPDRFFKEFINVPGKKDMGVRVQKIRHIWDLDERLRVMDEFGPDYCQVLSLGAPPLEALGSPDESPRMAQIGNDGMAELVRKHPQRFPAFAASLPMNNPDAAVKELVRSVEQMGAAGIQIYTNVVGKPLDAPEFLPLFEEAARLDVPIWIHPARGAEMPDYATEEKSLYEIWWTLGWPYETSVAMSRLVFSKILDRLPGLKIITHHMGGMIPYFEGRVGYGWDQLGKRTTDEDYFALLKSLKKRPVDYFRLFYADTALFGAVHGTRCGLGFFGADQVVFASDCPFEPTPGLYIRETIRVIESLDLSAEDKDKIYRGNAARLLKLKV